MRRWRKVGIDCWVESRAVLARARAPTVAVYYYYQIYTVGVARQLNSGRFSRRIPKTVDELWGEIRAITDQTEKKGDQVNHQPVDRSESTKRIKRVRS